MPRTSTYPTLYNECNQISITKLKLWGYLRPNQIQKSSIHWSIDGYKTGSIDFLIDMHSNSPYIELSYKFTSDGTAIKYKVELKAVPSNIGKGICWYFICPHTKKACRKLYLVDRYFLHRTAFVGCFYEKQTESHKSRNLSKWLDGIFSVDTAHEQIHSKHFTPFYKGKPTKAYLRLLRKIEQGSIAANTDIFAKNK